MTDINEVKERINELIKNFIEYANTLMKSPRVPLRKATVIKCECEDKKYDYMSKEFCTSHQCSTIETAYIYCCKRLC